MHYILLESVGNQSFIFATNRLREIVGASQAIVTLTTLITEAAERERAEVVYATSGKALLRCKGKDAAKSMIGAVTEQVLASLPGIDVRGVFIEEPKANNSASHHTAIQQAHRRLDEARCLWPGPEARFVQLPPVSLCASSPWPAAIWDIGDPKGGASSASAVARRSLVGVARVRMDGELGGHAPLPKHIGELDALLDGDWLAVVHADVNRLGTLFERFDEVAAALPRTADDDAEHYRQCLKAVSEALDLWARHAFKAALAATAKQLGIDASAENSKDRMPVVPLVLGGDDLTLACSGSWGLILAMEYVRRFPTLTVDPAARDGKDDAIEEAAILLRQVAAAGNRPSGGFSVAAGVALVKPHYPLHAAFDLAGRLTRNAKTAGRLALGDGVTAPCSAVDFHVQYDAAGTDLETTRRGWYREGEDGIPHRLSARPYLVPPAGTETRVPARDWARLEEAARDCRTSDDTRLPAEEAGRGLSRVLLHGLRDDLFRDDPETADRHLRRVANRYRLDAATLVRKGDGGWTLFHEAADIGSEGTPEALWITHLLDGLDAAPFLPEPQDRQPPDADIGEGDAR